MSDQAAAVVRPEVGSLAPDFTLPDQNGKDVTLSELVKEKAVVLYFYPKDETPGCTAEACAFRDSYEVFSKAGAEVVGVSSDSVSSHQAFAGHHQLPFILLSDEGGKVRKRYGARSLLGLMPGRVTYVVDRERVIRHLFSSQLDAQRHVREAMEIIRKAG
ncbi:MAG TPA: peroxiredoxin [Candidatus Dormibacteraeota bacterium]|jgi:peroxiredoxin Q/BCP|nr:peroxiredoxin [Candidatus Dormibacteraeota bacterium]